MVMTTHHLFPDLFSTFYPLRNVEMGFALNVVDFRIRMQWHWNKQPATAETECCFGDHEHTHTVVGR